MIVFFCFIFFVAHSQNNNSFALYLIGDAGEDTIPGKALLMLKDELLAHPKSAVVFLGDNVYPNGLKKNNHESELHLESQLQILKEYKGRVCFVPGNHDWDGQKASGLKILKNEELYIKEYLSKNSNIANKPTVFLPENGLPGPETILLNPHLRLILIDTQWFLHFYKKNVVGSKKQTKELFYKHLDSLLNLAEKNNEQVVIAAHHPLYSNGKHSKSKQPLRFLLNYTPFQFFGLMGLNRLYSQDMQQPRYKKMRKKLLFTISNYSNIIYASGHDHNLQCFQKGEGNNKFIVSGAGSKLSSLRKKKKYESVFQDDKSTGFIKIEFKEGEKEKYFIYRVRQKELELNY